jgi:quercetin dioxygenase-like cupin family protein
MASVLVFGTRQAGAQDPVKVAPEAFKVLLENPHVRVLEVNVKPGAKIAAYDLTEHVGYVTSGGKIKFTAADGKTAEEMDFKVGEVKYGVAEKQIPENVGTSPVSGVIVELRGKAPAGATTLGVPSDKDPVKISGDVVKVLFENARVRVTETTLKPGGKLAMHGHPPHVVYTITGSKIKGTDAAGKPIERDLAKGTAIWSDVVTHAVENAGATESRVLNFELKQAAAPAGH